MTCRHTAFRSLHSLSAAVVIALFLGLRAPETLWVASIEDAILQAEAESRVVLVAMGELGEARSRRHAKSLYGSAEAAPYMERMINVAAWSFDGKEAKRLPKFSGMEPIEHRGNREVVEERWVTPNKGGAVALPHHVWVSPTGEVLLSCPFEIDELEFAWCAAEALRRAGASDVPAPPAGARPPRRLLMGQTYKLPDSDEVGRGLLPRELDGVTSELQKRFLSMQDQREVLAIMSTDEKDAAEFIEKQLGLWDMSRAGRGIIDWTVGLMGQVSTSAFIDVIAGQATSDRASRRAQVAVALEQLGDPDGLKSATRGWKKEKDPAVKAEWILGVAACGCDDRGAIRTVLKAARKDKDDRVRRSAILGLGHVLPREEAREFLLERVAKGPDDERDAAVVALALGRCTEARAALDGLAEAELEAASREKLEAALAVLDGGNLHLIEDAFKELSGSELQRGRLFFRASASRFGRGRGRR